MLVLSTWCRWPISADGADGGGACVLISPRSFPSAAAVVLHLLPRLLPPRLGISKVGVLVKPPMGKPTLTADR